MQKVTRRTFLTLAAVAAGSAATAACGATPTATPVPPTATKAAAPATAAPSAAVSPAATKPSAAATAAPAPAATAPAIPATPAVGAQKIGKNLIGKLEGPTLITDPSKIPTTFNEAPMLADLVKAGKLPPVKERVSDEPIVLQPLQAIGKYGGTWRRAFTGPADEPNGQRTAGIDSFVFWDFTGVKTLVPNIAKKWELSQDGTTTTLSLRKNVKWSDGVPFDADDVVFWYEDIFLNNELVPTKAPVMSINGKIGKVVKVDQYTVQFVFPDPYYIFPEILAGQTFMQGHSNQGAVGGGGFAPAHYMKQFHTKYAVKAELDAKIVAAKFDTWVKFFLNRNNWCLNPDLPILLPWHTTTPSNTNTWTLERNPYSIWVDTAGNQLPYIDKIVMTLAENLEVLNLRAIAGEIDCQERSIDLAKLPVFLDNQAKGNYTMHLDPVSWGSDFALALNQTYSIDPEIGKWLSNVDFRHALSLGIDRDQINESFWLGTGTPGSIAPDETNKDSPGPEWRSKWATYDPTQANSILDKIGLDKKDDQSFRLRSDGKGRLHIEIVTQAADRINFTAFSQMIVTHWKKIGIEAQVTEVERNLATTRGNAGQNMIIAATPDTGDNLYLGQTALVPTGGSGFATISPDWGAWYATQGKSGKEPDAQMKQVMDYLRKGPGLQEVQRIANLKEMWKILIEQCYTIGVIALGTTSQGVRLVKNNMGNVPQRQFNSPHTRTPASSRPMTYYFKS